ncbi:thioredoxin [Suhomyces tanzawaensis NRRL Y-17324]|uniref:Thioredoxin n=1 Tax=Suhomyces tanzawaensis NRRL Y-17324 TaxID=984487 RepID=A0A1E4SF12_9ASCO|nr:thioredoxin [Suhomyces tanzawaensis NRRL Y-17324]ODV78055.1 thioredoxin [Suhomyces tanzawaensis NRRL Y-17324]
MLRTLGLRSLRAPVAFRPIRRGLATSESNIKEIADLPQFREFISNTERVSVIDFYATWCGPCKALEPIFDMLAQRVPEVQFGRVDVDAAQDVAGEYGITAMPTCLFFKDGQKVDTIIGANPPKLVELIQKHGDVKIGK